MYGLSDELVIAIRQIASRLGVQRLVLFGSRARGDFNSSSDIDLAVYGLRERDELSMLEALDALPTLMKFDMIPVRQGLDESLLGQIEKDGVVLMENSQDRLKQLQQALERTKEAIAEFDRTQSDVVRDGVIQRFEFSAELAWKSCRDRLLDEGFINIDSPKSVMKQAFASGLITDEQGWLKLLQARNLTSRVYGEQQASKIYKGIVEKYVPLMAELSEALRSEL